MRRLAIKILVLVALAWGGWWWIATGGLQRGAAAWLEAQRDQGITAQAETWSRGGFPLRIATTAQNTQWTDAQRNTSVQIPAATLSTPIYWPGDARIEMPEQAIILSTPQAEATLSLAGLDAQVQLHPGTSLQLEALSSESGAVSLDLVEGRILALQSLQAEVQQGDNPSTYTIDLTAMGLSVGSIVRQGLQLPATLPDMFEPVIADMTVTFDRPWDRSALEASRPQPRVIQIEQITAIWGDIGASMTGDLTVDAAGVPTGTITVNLRNWQQLFDLAMAGLDTVPQWAATAQLGLQSMSDSDGTLNLNVTIAQGQMRMGFFPLGPAPRLIIR
ncbi:DUF2125 domain-containing protein [uncultured Sulfitobacter sp.]|uniref:DUF2125 domain-containing protein n=1 Tax=uncultured Sulfitobacter sp. TaxID=191468 RepID=UPI00261155D5|nr:DUF2125 domain-containing protein [uncultured Sulfitobacter sp.]